MKIESNFRVFLKSFSLKMTYLIIHNFTIFLQQRFMEKYAADFLDLGPDGTTDFYLLYL